MQNDTCTYEQAKTYFLMYTHPNLHCGPKPTTPLKYVTAYTTQV